MIDKIKGSVFPAIFLIIAIVVSLFLVIKMNVHTNKNNLLVENLAVGESKKLESNIENGFILWESKNEEIATVDNGVVKGISEGETIISLYVNGKIENEYKVIVKTNDVISPTPTENSPQITPKNNQVTPSPNVEDKSTPTPVVTDKNQIIEAQSISIKPSYLKINIGESAILTVVFNPTNTTNQNIEWTSSDNQIATVSNGIIKGIKEGKVIITGKTKNGKIGSVNIDVIKNNITPSPKVQNEIMVSGISLNITNKTINVGETVNLIANISPSNATNKNVIWSSSNQDIAMVDNNGVVKGIKAGVVTITAKTNNNKVASANIIINNKETGTTTITPTLSVSVPKTTINLGETLKVTGTNNTGSKITYTSSNNKIATIDNNGNIKTLRTGTVIFKASSDNLAKTVTISIKGYRLHFIDLNTNSNGDAILLESNGSFALVDTGKTAGWTALKNYLNKYDINSQGLDFIIISHPHVDHNGNMVNLLNNYKIGRVYMKKYTNKDAEADLAHESETISTTKQRYDSIINKIKEKKVSITYVDSSSDFVESANKSGVVKLGGNMNIHFFNTTQRIVNYSNSNAFNYFTSNDYRGSGENLNSLVNLVRVNGHNALLTGDLNNYDILNYIVKYKADVAYKNGQTLDVYKIPHHGNFNCTGLKPLKVSSKYYIVTENIDDKFSDNSYRITNDSIKYKNGKTYDSCFKNMGLNMCNAYYTENSSSGAIVVDFTNTKATISGGGLGKNVSNRCK